MKKIIQNVKDSVVVVVFGIAVILGSLGLSSLCGCASMYDENGNLTEQTQTQIRETAAAVKVVTDSFAPATSPIVGAVAGVFGGVATLVGQMFFRRKV